MLVRANEAETEAEGRIILAAQDEPEQQGLVFRVIFKVGILD